MKTSLLAGAGLITLAGTALSWQGQAFAPVSATPHAAALANGQGASQGPFQRIASFPVFQNTDVDDETVAEIVAASEDGMLLIYTDSETENLGFIDIANPANPTPAGALALGGEPTSVAVHGGYALVCINTSADFVNTSGDLLVVDIASRQIVRTLPLGGQPDSIAVSPDGRYAAICIENERDEDLGNGEPPQAPAGFLVIADLIGDPSQWGLRQVNLTGVADLFPEDPEPEYVDINAFNIAAVTLQENNHCVLVSLWDGRVLYDFPFGTVNLTQVDDNENDLIQQDASLQGVPREPDAITWTSLFTLATADEGDLFGGSRGFTTFSFLGFPLFRAGNSVEHLAASIGHYPESRSENKGTEPEGIEYGRFGGAQYLFVGSERGNFVLVYELFGGPFLANAHPVLRQALPTGVGPEGLLAIPSRDLFVVACEVDGRDDKIRSTVMIYANNGQGNYPEIESRNRPDGTPIPWSALSGLATRPQGQNLFAVHDSYYQQSRFFTLRPRPHGPVSLREETVLQDNAGVLLQTLQDLKGQLPNTPDFDPADLVNADGTVNLDLEGIDAAPFGRMWFASEGAGNLVNGVSDPNDRPFESPNLLVRTTREGAIEEVILPPLEVTQNQLRFGFEGVAFTGRYVYVAFQRAWQAAGDPSDRARIGRYDRLTQTWGFAHYPLDAVTSPAGGWVGLSELTHLGGRDFAVIERDNQGGPDATIKRIQTFSVLGVDWKPADQVGQFELLTKSLQADLIAMDAYGYTGGPVPEKLEGMAVLRNGTVVVVNDNDGVDDNNGETRLLRLPGLLQ